MRTRLSILLTLCSVLLFAGFALAQSQDVQITKGPTVEHTGVKSAVIAWSTNKPSSTIVKYGTDRNNLNQTAEMPWGSLTHRVTIKNLQAGKTYYFQASSAQAQGSGTGAMSSIESFTTQGSSSASNSNKVNGHAEPMVQVVSGPIAQKVTATSAQIYWQTNEPSSTIVKYGTNPNSLNQTKQAPWGQQNHSVQLSSLQPNTEYYLQIQTTTGRVLQQSNFHTASTTAQNGQTGQFQITNGPNVQYLSSNSATIAWSTTAPSSSIVKYGTDPNALNQTAQAPWGQTTHRVTLNNLQPNTQYYVQVQSAQSQGGGQSAQVGPFPIRTVAPGQAAMTNPQ